MEQSEAYLPLICFAHKLIGFRSRKTWNWDVLSFLLTLYLLYLFKKAALVFPIDGNDRFFVILIVQHQVHGIYFNFAPNWKL